MKRFHAILSFIFILTCVSCKSVNTNEDDCQEITTYLINKDEDKLKLIIDRIAIDLTPISIKDDPLGHAANLQLLIERLNECITSERICYACVKTLPAISEILISVDSSGQMFKRIIDIATPKNAPLFLEVYIRRVPIINDI